MATPRSCKSWPTVVKCSLPGRRTIAWPGIGGVPIDSASRPRTVRVPVANAFGGQVSGSTATVSGYSLLPLIVGLIFSATMSGQIVARIMGEAREEDIRTPLEWLLHDRSGPPPTAMTKRY